MKSVFCLGVLALISSFAVDANAKGNASVNKQCAKVVAQYRAIREIETESRIQIARAVRPPSDQRDLPEYRDELNAHVAIRVMNKTDIAVQLEDLEAKLAELCPAPMLTIGDAKRHYSQLKNAGVEGLERFQNLGE